ncbi:hypothetical protein A8924_7410 [Saccharopolyspora erythraea NRRL 2338]|uniref:Uncharacterized protein n=2 Tax=Saccharopolyspora erythraea TaxID=1836 RepID=A4FQ55_SACEN|nr:hypothetical protein [Saccharopolyspora erythraea]EQD84388.1 hypothetical protein N599_20270 [Saccharopolyspora erythraea D]PFG99826.1 hypothetical protein A8924_7381 [Saccharopolyspora erythraea NRRL 2338]PFG99852.1 hypothetical protein A8924_7410 [Saccharopolyspora erythraea NRRL 2338]QRK89697.1 hypothetical protein JQX30_35140 [Saccharopolyspora erythraea]CAM06180.1 hypothetical protein SACE_7019 [Saccharopolyspora erythraea NRRL 2338]
MSLRSRNWDRSPETEGDRRFHDLRDSGYTGPIDQDGNPVTSGRDADILRRMAEERGETVDW